MIDAKHTPTLKPCPFCGGDAAIEQVDGSTGNARWTVGCNDTDEGEEGGAFSVLCYGYQSLTTFGTKAEAIAAWNRRAVNSHDAREALVKELVAALGEARSMLRIVAIDDEADAVFDKAWAKGLATIDAALARAKAEIGEGKG
jgi:Lar family restriction alleviation protein